VVRSQCDCYLSLEWSYQISAACHDLHHLYILFLTVMYGKCMLAECVGFLYWKAGGREFNLCWERDLANFFFSFSPSDVFFLSFFLYLFFHKDAYKCFPFIIFLNINAPIIIRKPILFLCSFHNNDNKCFVGYFWKLKKEKCSHTTRPWHSWNLSHYYFTMFLICRTVRRHFSLRQNNSNSSNLHIRT